MTAECFFAIVVICGIFVVCEIIGKLLGYKIPPLVLVMVIFIIFGGQLGIIPSDIMDTAGFSGMVYSFGLPFVLAGFGTTMSIKSIRDEGRTVIIALMAVGCILVLGLIAGFAFMDRQTAIYGAVEVAGGGQAGLVFLTHLKDQVGSERLVALMLCLMNMQLIFGYPLCSIGVRMSMKRRIAEGRIPEAVVVKETDHTEAKTLIRIPEFLKNNFYYIFFMLGIICFLSAKLRDLTTLSPYLWYILLGFAFAELGLVEHNCLGKAGFSGVMFGIMFAVVIQDFLTLQLADVAGVAMNFVILIAFGIIGSVISGFLAAKIFKLDFFEGFATSIGCMVGLPQSQLVSSEAMQAVRAEMQIDDETAARLIGYYDPKIIISGVITISLVTGLLAGIIVSFL